MKCSEEYSENMNYCPTCGATGNFKAYYPTKQRINDVKRVGFFSEPKWKRDLILAKAEMKVSLIIVPFQLILLAILIILFVEEIIDATMFPILYLVLNLLFFFIYWRLLVIMNPEYFEPEVID